MDGSKVAYALVQSTNWQTAEPRILSKHGVRDVIMGSTHGEFIVNFEDNFFNNTPAVTVTGLFNGWDGYKLNPVDTPTIPAGTNPCNQPVIASLEWVTAKSCLVITSVLPFQLGSWFLSFSIIAAGS